MRKIIGDAKMALNIRSFFSLDHPIVSFPQKGIRNGDSSAPATTANKGEREKFLEDWRRLLDSEDDKKIEADAIVGLKDLDII